MAGDDRGLYECLVEGAAEGDRYVYLLDEGLERPDPVSRWQPEGVHGPSMVVDPDSFVWTDKGWRGQSLSDYVIYELHVGAFTDAGTFEGAVPYLGYLKELGITAVELMPVAQFPGSRNWGYDGVYPYAPQNSYGGPQALKALIDACHRHGLSVVLDVVYNHLGPEGNYLHDFGPYFTDRYKTPWGSAVNFDGPQSDEVRRYFIDNARYWVSEFHADALRLDAIHGIFDFSARPILRELEGEVRVLAERLRRRVYVIAESDLNDARVITPTSLGGYAVDAQWNDDFHHSLHALLTGERFAYYADFGSIEQMATAIREGFVYSGQYSTYRRRSHGNSSRGRPARRFVQFSQNHDHVGNRPRGERLSAWGDPEKLKLAAAVVLLSPAIPLLFMGEEYGETAPFLYFVDYSDASLAESVRKGRAEEFTSFGWSGPFHDPGGEESFLSSKIRLEIRRQQGHAQILSFYRELLRLRKAPHGLGKPTRNGLDVRVCEGHRALEVTRSTNGEAWIAVLNFEGGDSRIGIAPAAGKWEKVLDSSSTLWGGPGEIAPLHIEGGSSTMTLGPYSAVVYRGLSVEAP